MFKELYIENKKKRQLRKSKKRFLYVVNTYSQRAYERAEYITAIPTSDIREIPYHQQLLAELESKCVTIQIGTQDETYRIFGRELHTSHVVYAFNTNEVRNLIDDGDLV